MLSRTFISAMLLIFFLPFGNAQHFIGVKKEEVKKLMKSEVKGLHEDRSARNPAFNMIKYVDRWGNQTMIFVFDDKDKCMYSKHMCDYSMETKMIVKLDEQYKKLDDATWTYKHGGTTYNITLKKDEWYFVLDTRKAEE